MIKNKKLIELSKSLIEIESDSSNQKELERVVNLAKKELSGFTVEEFESKGVKSILVYKGIMRPKKFKILLNGHLDVVPAGKSMYKPKIIGDKLFGRGSMDMKAPCAALIMAFREVAHKASYPIGLQLVSDEEIGGFNGTKYQISKGIRADFVLAGEPTDMMINNLSKGIVWVRVTAYGKPAHGAYPWDGENAIWKMTKFLSVLNKNYPEFRSEKWKTSVNLARIETTNQSFNKVPDSCTVSLDVRYIPGDDFVRRFKKIVPKDFEIEYVVDEPHHDSNKEDFFIKALSRSINKLTKKKAKMVAKHGASDVRHFTKYDSSAVTFGPIGKGLHSENEWVSIKSLEKYYEILLDFLNSIS